VLALFAGILVGVVPALRASRVDLDEMLRDSRHGFLMSGGRHRVHSALVAAQIAMCFVLPKLCTQIAVVAGAVSFRCHSLF
jgi:hypothetical protein